MWFGKWAISSILLHENIIANAISEFTVHTGQTVIEGEAITKSAQFFETFVCFWKWPYFMHSGGYALYSLLKIDWRKAVHAFANIIPVLCVSLVPFAWIFVTSSHASWCYWYTYRGFIASIFGFYAALKIASAKRTALNLLNKFSYYFTFSNKPCTYKAKQQNTTDINRACKYSECPLCQLQIQLQEQLLTDMLQ